MHAPVRRFLALSLLATAPLAAQPSFVEVTPQTNPYFVTPATDDFWVNAVAPADVDGDGDLDLAVIGFYVVYFESAVDLLLVLSNDGPDAEGNWQFTAQDVPLGDLYAGGSDLAWGDFDGDGDHDLAVGSEGATSLYRNDAGTLVALPSILPGYYEDSGYTGAYDLRSITWADADNDGDLDLLLPSVFDFDAFEYSTRLLRNDGSDGAGGWLLIDTAAALDPTVHAQSSWGDDDGDGDLDLFLVNIDPYTETGFVRRYANDGGGAFVGADLVGIRIEYGLADWGDADGDGDFDLLVAGNIQEEDLSYATVLRLYQSADGAYVATDLLDSSASPWLDIHAATWADYDSDGDVDVLVTGNYVGDGEIVGRSEIWGNEAGTFSSLGIDLPAPVSSVGRGGAFTWLDLDGDGDLDYLVAGAYYVAGGNGLVEARMHLYRNDTPIANQAPAAPEGLSAFAGDSFAALSWDPAADDLTPQASITYDLELRPAGAPAPLGAAHRLPEPGSLSTVTSWTLGGLAPGSYDWSVRAVDSAFNGGATASGSFSIPGAGIFADDFETGDTRFWEPSQP